jgi:hypothetical protein
MGALAVAAVAVGILVGGGNEGVARCEQAIVGHGPAGWRSQGVVAGPVGVRERPLARMSRTSNGLVTKMGVLVEGREPETVTVSVPRTLRKRVFLYFGDANSFAGDRGLGAVEFELCPNKPRTIWPGGIRVKGTKPVRLTVASVDGSTSVLRLGAPKVFDPDRL